MSRPSVSRLLACASVIAVSLAAASHAAAQAVAPNVCLPSSNVEGKQVGSSTYYTLPIAADCGVLNNTAVGAASSAGTDGTSLNSAYGHNASANGGYATAIGAYASTSAIDATAVGVSSTASAQNATVVGRDSTASGVASTVLGGYANATGTGSLSVGASSLASGDESSAFGRFASASGTNSVAIGANSSDGGQDNVVSFGSATQKRTLINIADGTVVLGSAEAVNGGQLYDVQQTANTALTTANGALQTTGGTVTGAVQLASGASLDLGGNKITSVGAGSVAATSTDAVNGSQLYSVQQTANGALQTTGGTVTGAVQFALGASLDLGGNQITGLQNGRVSVDSTDAIAGNQFWALQNYVNTIGTATSYFVVNSSGPTPTAGGAEAIAVGSAANAAGTGAVAVGNGASAAGAGSVALGAGASAKGADSVALGAGAIATAPNEVALGTAASTYSLPGVQSAASQAAQQGAVRLVTADANGDLGTSSIDVTTLAGLPGRVGSLETRVTDLESRVGVLEDETSLYRRQANGGIAAAMAMSGTMAIPNKRLTLSLNLSTYRGEQGFSGAFVGRLADRVYMSAGVAGSTIRGSTGGRVGMAIGF